MSFSSHTGNNWPLNRLYETLESSSDHPSMPPSTPPSSHLDEILSYFLSKLTFDLFTGMPARHGTSSMARTAQTSMFASRTLSIFTLFVLRNKTRRGNKSLITSVMLHLSCPYRHMDWPVFLFWFFRLSVINNSAMDPIISDFGWVSLN